MFSEINKVSDSVDQLQEYRERGQKTAGSTANIAIRVRRIIFFHFQALHFSVDVICYKTDMMIRQACVDCYCT